MKQALSILANGTTPASLPKRGGDRQDGKVNNYLTPTLSCGEGEAEALFIIVKFIFGLSASRYLPIRGRQQGMYYGEGFFYYFHKR
ncbi:hypothetical protein [Dysgonomonas sp. 521]|uniref:hypothetical protein n=1 Tax=Dysgonomonas sp. 521 TaxID=2302932 RepID=UPI0013D4B286|nr:hypothetical protein [Dysgonomonas sp. 521]